MSVARRIVVLPALALALATPAGPAVASVPNRARSQVVIVTLDGTMLADWTSPKLPNFEALLADGALALLSTRVGNVRSDPLLLRASAYLSFGAGTRVEAEVREDRIAARVDGAAPGALAAVLARARKRAVALGGASGGDAADQSALFAAIGTTGAAAVSVDATARLVAPDGALAAIGPRTPTGPAAVGAPPEIADPRFPTGRRTDLDALLAATRDALDWARVVVVDVGDTARIERALGFAADVPDLTRAARDAWMRITMRRVDAFLGELRASLKASDVLAVVSPTPPAVRAKRGRHLTVAALAGGGFAPGLLSSGTTRREGVITLADLAPTILQHFAVPVPSEMDGRVAVQHAADDAPARLRALERDLIHAHRIRRPLLRGMFWAAMGVALLGLATVARGRGAPAGHGPAPAAWRDLLATAAIAVIAAPLAMLLEPLLPTATVSSAAVAVIVLAVGLAILSRALLGRERALLAVLTLTTAAILADLAAGTPLAARSALGFQVAGGGRFYGIDEGTMGAGLGAALIAGGIALDRAHDPRRTLAVLGAGVLALVVLMGAPGFGSKFGAPFTVIPAVGVIAARALGRRVDRVVIIGIAIATMLAVASFAAADVMSAPESQSHIGRAFGGRTAIGPLIARKVSATFRITFSTIWLPAFVVFAGSVLLLAWRRGAIVARGLWGRPYFRAALWAAAVGAVAGMAANDAGIIASSPLAMMACASFFVLLLAPE